MAKVFECPACGKPMEPPRVSLSRFFRPTTSLARTSTPGKKLTTAVYICSPCGVREAMEGFFWADKPTAKNPPNQKGFEPW